MAIAAPALHYTLFPWRLRFGLPVLDEAAGQHGLALAFRQLASSHLTWRQGD